MRAGMLAVAGSVIILYPLGALPPPWLVAVTAVVLTLFAFPAAHFRKPLVVSAFVFAILYVVIDDLDRVQSLRDHWPVDSRPVSVRGYPCSVPESIPGGGVRVIFCITDGTGTPSLRVRLRVPEAQGRESVQGAMAVALQPREQRSRAGSGQFDLERYWFRHRLVGDAVVTDMQPLPGGPCGLQCRYHGWRQALVVRLEHHAGHAPHYPLMESLAFGSRGLLENDHWDTLRATGTNHLLAISGLHVGLVAGFALLIGRRLLRGHPREPVLTYLIMLSASGLYALAAGFTIPTRRALIMVAVAGWVLLSGRRLRAWDGWLLAMTLVLIVDPMAPLDMGFWLSFGAVACLILAFSGRLKGPGALWGLALAQVAVVGGLWPILAALEQPASALAFPANLVAIPLMSLLVMPLLFVALVPLLTHEIAAQGVLPGMELLFALAWSGLTQLSEHVIWFPDWSVPMTLAAAAALLLMLFPVGALFRVVTVAVVLILLWVPADPRSSEAAITEVRFLDVEHGQSVLVRDQGWTLLYDLGQRGWGRYRRFDRAVPNALDSLGVRSIDTLVISDGSAEEAAAYLEQSDIAVEAVISGERGQGCAGTLPSSSGSLTVSLWQWQAHSDTRPSAHCVALITAPDGRLLIPGRVDRRVERRILQWLGPGEKVQALVLPGRGAPRSSQLSWVEWLAPEWVVAPRYSGVDQNPVLERYRKSGARTYQMACRGELVWHAETGQVEAYRDRRRLWLRPCS